MPRARDGDLLRRTGYRVAEARRARGFSQEQLAEAIGIQPVTLSRLETGHRALTLTKLEKISSALNVALSALLDDTQPLPDPELRADQLEVLRLWESLDEGGKDAVLRVLKKLAG